ncbi:helix-turn-helix domain-containing protein [Roseateles sp.]|uniref:helix-turn-helix domain-containing protein n=1 Tax=Roseateles sp. TaxID=1971397 RepID=UPI003265F49F
MSQTCDLNEAAALMKIHPKTVADHIDSGALPAARIGRAYVMLTKDVMALIEREIVKQTAERMRRVTPADPFAKVPVKRRRRVGR